MNLLKSLLIAFLLNIYLFENSISSLVSIFEIIRHGARTSKPFSNINSILNYDTKTTQLTFSGFTQHLLFGNILRKQKKYKKFFLNSSIDILAISSPVERCIFSAIAHLTGLFPKHLIEYNNINKYYGLNSNNDYPPNYEQQVSDYLINFKKKVKLNIEDPISDVFFHAKRCYYSDTNAFDNYNTKDNYNNNNNNYNNNLTIINQLPNEDIFDISKNEIIEAIIEIQESLILTYKDIIKEKLWNFKYDNTNYNKYAYSDVSGILRDLVEFIVPLRYHISEERYNKLKFSKRTELIILKDLIQNFYGRKLNNLNQKTLLINEFVKTLNQRLNHSIDNFKKTFTLLSGHDSNIVNLISFFLNTKKLKRNIIKNIEKLSNEKDITIRMDNRFVNLYDNIDNMNSDYKDKYNKLNTFFKTIIPPFASSLIIELHNYKDNSDFNKKNNNYTAMLFFKNKENILKEYSNTKEFENYYVKIFMNNIELKNDLVDDLKYVDNKGITLNTFIKYLSKKTIDTNVKLWKC